MTAALIHELRMSCLTQLHLLLVCHQVIQEIRQDSTFVQKTSLSPKNVRNGTFCFFIFVYLIVLHGHEGCFMNVNNDCFCLMIAS